jgi:SNF2 family DNA or RNA helicase
VRGYSLNKSETNLVLRDGKVFKESANASSKLSARDLYLYLTDSNLKQTMEVSVRNLSLSKRAVILDFYVNIVEGSISITPSWRGTILEKHETEAAYELGYFIRDTRIFFLSEDTRKELSTVIDGMQLLAAISFVRKLKIDGRLLSDSSNLVTQLIQSNKTDNSYATLFVRNLYPYQQEGVDWLCFCVRNGIGTILADDMGLGKTAQLIATICDTIQREPNSCVLIVIPNPLIDNWIREFSFFAPSIVPYVHYGLGRSGLAKDLASQQVVIMPYTTLHNDLSMITEIHFRLAIFDEASMIKNPKSARSISAFSINADVKIAATGTPVENILTDVWTLTELVFPSYLGSLETFRQMYIGKDINATLSRDLGDLEESLRQITLRRMKKDVLEQLPEKMDIHFPISMQEHENQAYTNLISEIRNDASAGGSNMLALINKLQQFTSHPFLINHNLNTSIQALCSASSKFEVFIDYLDKIQSLGEKVLVFATYTKMIDLISVAIKSRFGIESGVIDGRTPNSERQNLIDQFSVSSGFSVLVLHPRTAGMGFNITAASHVIHYSRQWNPALEMQATARAWRNGQKNKVSVYYLFYANTIEEIVDERLRLKQELSDTVISVADEKESDKQLLLNYLEHQPT